MKPSSFAVRRMIRPSTRVVGCSRDDHSMRPSSFGGEGVAFMRSYDRTIHLLSDWSDSWKIAHTEATVSVCYLIHQSLSIRLLLTRHRHITRGRLQSIERLTVAC